MVFVNFGFKNIIIIRPLTPASSDYSAAKLKLTVDRWQQLNNKTASEDGWFTAEADHHEKAMKSIQYMYYDDNKAGFGRFCDL